MSTQKSLVLPAAHGNWELAITDVPTPGLQDVLVKIAATSLNPLDWKIQAFGLYVQSYAHVAGCEAAGTVEEVGAEVKNLAQGDRMYVLPCVCDYISPVLTRSAVSSRATSPIRTPRSNSTASYLRTGPRRCGVAVIKLVDAVPDKCSQIPDNVSFDQAASVPLGLATVATGLWSHHPDARSANWPAPWEQEGTTKFAGKPALILGGSSSVGQYGTSSRRCSSWHFPDFVQPSSWRSCPGTRPSSPRRPRTMRTC